MSGARPIKMLSKAWAVIDVLAERGALTPAMLSQELDIPRPSVYRLVDGLQAIELVEPAPEGRVRLSRRWLHLADAGLAGLSEWGGAAAVLDDLVERTGQTAFLSVPRGGRAVCIRWAQGRGVEVLALRPGGVLPFHAGAAGRVLLAHLSDDRIDEVLAAAPFAALTSSTLTDVQEVREDIAVTRSRGYCLSVEDVTPGIAALGVPVRNGGVVVGAVSIGGLVDEISEAHLAPLLVAAERLQKLFPHDGH